MTTAADPLFDAWTQVDTLAHDLLTPIATEAQHERALETIDAIMAAIGQDGGHPLTTLLDLLVGHVHAYEEEHHALPEQPPGRLLAYLIEQHNTTQSALAEATGINQSNLSKLIRGEREFNANQIKVLSEHFRVNPAVFLR